MFGTVDDIFNDEPEPATGPGSPPPPRGRVGGREAGTGDAGEAEDLVGVGVLERGDDAGAGADGVEARAAGSATDTETAPPKAPGTSASTPEAAVPRSGDAAGVTPADDGVAEVDSASDVAGFSDEEARTPFYGLSWDIVERLCDLRGTDTVAALRATLAIRATGKPTMTVANLARALKRTETATTELAAQLPSLFRLTHRDSKVAMRDAPIAPDDLTAEQRRAKERDRVLAERAARREEAQLRKDAEDTGFNRLRLKLMQAGMGLDEARATTGTITRLYGWDASLKAVDLAIARKPHSPRGYIMGILKGGAAGNLAAGSGGVVRSQLKPDPTGVTRRIGWEDREVQGRRHELFRLPNGKVKRSEPARGAVVPTFEEDPGTPWES